MINDANSVPSNTKLQVDVCIVGSGAAGISLALSLANKGLSILMLESGFPNEDKPTQSLYDGEVVDELLHSPPIKYRQRRFGGSTTIWGGRCMPFDEIDFEKRDYIPDSGWPIAYSELAPFYAKSNTLAEVGNYEYDGDVVFNSDTKYMFKGFESDRVRTNSLERFSCPTNFAVRYDKRLRAATDIELLYGANCTFITLEENNKSVKEVKISTLKGNTFSVSSRFFVLASGGIENARLLLASRDKNGTGVGNTTDTVGRYYMCHIAGNVGELSINQPYENVRHGYEVSPEGIYCRRRLCLTAETQRDLGVGNMVARLHFPRIADPSHRNGVLSGLFLAKNFISYEYGKRLNDGIKKSPVIYAQHLSNIIFDPVDTTSFAYNWLTKRTLAQRKFPSVILKNKTNRFSLEIHGEQIPQRESRITLSDSIDVLGMPKVKIDWRYHKHDIYSVKQSLDVFSAEFLKAGVGTFTYDPESLEEDLIRFGAYGGHHIGTTRMGCSPNNSSVDKNCKLHHVDNLYIAGSSVFPTSSQANPTLTIIALALRLGDHFSTLLNVRNNNKLFG